MSTKPDDEKSSKWGKGKTDPESWWKKGGKSPNPNGRPKGSKNQKTLWREASEVKISVTMDGQKKEMAKKELGYHQIASKAAAGDLKAISMQLHLDEKFDSGESTPPTQEESAADFQTLDEWVKLRELFKVFKMGDDVDG
ncbi:DUF5681 domain-containing protein [Novosphingobium aquiterrae]|uniref:DUF5681 domain-containing protein n=1 Tax=Novosphingobium aquiterrae TaxID=624388 RepID=A0ABV6PGV3_9SPHN